MKFTNLLVLGCVTLSCQSVFAGTLFSRGDDPYNTERGVGASLVIGVKEDGESTTLNIDGSAAELLYRRLEVADDQDSKSGENVKCWKHVEMSSVGYECHMVLSSTGQAIKAD